MFWNPIGEGTGGASHCVGDATSATRHSAVAAHLHPATHEDFEASATRFRWHEQEYPWLCEMPTQ